MKKTSNGMTGARLEAMKKALEDAGMVGEKTHKKSKLVRAVYSLDYAPVHDGEDLSQRCDLIRFDNAIYFNYSKPNRAIANDKSKPVFNVYCSSVSLKTYLDNPKARRFYSYADFLKKAETNKFLALLRDCSNLDETVFRLAYENPYTSFTVSIDHRKYLKKVGCHTLFNVWEEY